MRPGLIIQSDLIDAATSNFRTKKVVAFIGGPLSGKSTFLEIIAGKLRDENIDVLHFRVSSGTTASNLIRQITTSLQFELTTLGDELHVESLLRHLNAHKIYLILDDCQNLIDPAHFIEGMLDRLIDARLILSSTEIPTLPKDRIFEVGLVRARAFNQDEVTHLVGTISIPATTSDVIPAVEKLHQLSAGAPDLIKLALGDLYASGLSLTTENIITAFQSAQAERLLRITKKVSDNTKEALSAAALVKFDTSVEHQIISTLSDQEKRQLQDLGLIVLQSNHFVLQHKDLWRNLITDAAQGRALIIKFAKSLTGFLPIREQIYQLKDLEDWKEYVTVFDNAIIEYESFFPYQEIAKLTDGLNDHLSSELMGYRATSLRATGESEKSLRELEDFLKKDLQPEERRWIEYQIFRSKMYVNNRDNLHAGFLKLFKESHPTEKTYYRTLCYCLQFAEQLNTGKISGSTLEDLYKSTIDLLEKTFSADKTFKALTHTEFAFVFERQGMLQLRDQCLEDALKFYSNNNPASFDTLHLRMLVSEAKNQFQIQRNVRAMFRLTEEARLLGLDYLVAEGAGMESLYATAQGKADYSLSYLRKIWNGNLDKISSMHLFHITAAIHGWLLQGNFSEAHTYLKNKLGSLNSNSDNLIIYTLLRSRDCFDYLVSPDQKTQPTISPEVQITERNVHSLANMLSLLDLHSYYQFEQIIDRVIERVDWNSKAYLRAIGLTQPHFAWRELLAGRLKIANTHFTAAVDLSRREEMYFYQFRSLSGMIVLALQEDQFAKANDLLAEAKSIAPLMDPVENLPELHLLPILEVLCLIRTDEKPAARQVLQATKKFKRYEFLRQSLLNELGINTREEVYNPGAPEKKFSERLLELSKVKLQSRYEFRDHLATHSILEEIPKLRKGNDFVWDRVKGELLIGREKFELQDKPLIEELLYFLVCHPNESYTKEQLIGFVWRESYNPLVHDSRIYTSVKRIRQMFASLGEKEVVIQDAGRYGLSREIKFVVISRASQDLPILPRQKWVIEFVDQNGTIDRLTAENVLDISAAQVKRDLKDLVDRGFLSIDGSGRAAKYIRGRTS